MIDFREKIGSTRACLVMVAVFPLGIFAVLKRISWISQLAHPNSTDAYFYLKEFQTWMRDGAGYYESYSTFFTVTSLAGRLFGLSEERLFFSVAVCGLIFLSAGLGLLAAGRKTAWLVPIAVILPWLSDLIFFRHFAFVRQSFSVGLAVLGAALLLRRELFFRRTAALVAGWSLLTLACLMHSFTAAASITLLAGVCLFHALLDIRYKMFALAAIAAAAVVAGIFLTHGTHREIFSDQIALGGGVSRICGVMACSTYELAELYFWFGAATFAALWAAIKGRKDVFLISAAFLYATLNLPIWHWESGLGFRLAIASVWIAMVMGVVAARELSYTGKVPWFAEALIALVYFGFLNTYHKEYTLERPPIPFLRANADKLKQWLPSDTFVIAQHGVEFAVTYLLERRSALKMPAEESVPALATIEQTFNYGECYRLNPGDPAPPPETACVDLGNQFVLRIVRRGG